MSDVRVFNAALEDDDETAQIIIRGRLDQTTLRYVNIAWYQRERGFSPKHINEIIAAFFAGAKVADITIGMRGQRVKSRGNTYVLLDKCFCVDGGQRLYAAALALKERPDLKLRLGAKIYLGTTEEWENELFCRLGTTQVKIGPSILLRNRRKKSAAANLLVTLNGIPEFALKDRVAWDQRKTRHELMFGYSVARIVGTLHAHLVGGLRSAKCYDLLVALDALIERIGEDKLRTNVIRFFDTIDKCWTIRQLSGGHNEARPHLKPAFLLTIARLFSKYSEFWDGPTRDEFYCGDRYIKRLKTFALAKYVVPASIPTHALYEIIRKHLQLDPAVEADLEAAE